ncbi:MAG TPA: hypothetical protein VD736_02815 [Nitrososphaera sp.]|nr:hypothetical protein [Nitrososphaera sp.]
MFGEIVNDRDDWSAANIMINATFYGSFAGDQTVIIGNMSGSPYFDFLNPRKKSGFELIAYGQVSGELASFSYYSISLTWDKVQEQKPGLLKLQVRNASLDPCGNYHITGTVTNYDKHKTKNVIVSATFYNNRNQIVATSYAKLGEDQILAPTKSDSFTFLIEKSALPHFAYYSLNVQNANYSSFSSDNFETRNSDSSFSSGHDKNIPTITVFSDSTIYHVGTNAVEISGRVSYPSSQHNDENTDSKTKAAANLPRVLIKIMTPTGNTLERITAPLYANGTFSKTINFVSLNGSEGQVYNIIAEYDNGIGENTFAIGYSMIDHDLKSSGIPDNPVIQTSSKLSELCREVRSPITIAQLGWRPIATVDTSTIIDSANDSDWSNEISYSTDRDEKIRIGSTVMLSAIAVNELSEPHPVVVVFEVFDPSGTTVFLHLDSHILDPGPNSTYEAIIPWSANETGIFTVKTFAISGFDQPNILSPTVQSSLNVSQD